VLDDSRRLDVVMRVQQHRGRVVAVHPLAEHIRRRSVDVALPDMLEARDLECGGHGVGAALDIHLVRWVAADARDAHQLDQRGQPLAVLLADGPDDGVDVVRHDRFDLLSHRSTVSTVGGAFFVIAVRVARPDDTASDRVGADRARALLPGRMAECASTGLAAQAGPRTVGSRAGDRSLGTPALNGFGQSDTIRT